MADIIDIIKAVKGLAVDFGTVSAVASAGSSGLEDASKNWAPGMHRDRLVRVVDGAGAGQTRVIADNSESTLVTQTPWARPLDATSVYVILNQGAERLLVDIALLLARIGNPDVDALTSLSDKLGDMQRPLYLTIDEIGRWDAGGSLSTDIVSLLNDIAVILASVGPANGSTLGSLYGILGDPAQDFDTMVGYEGATSLADKLTLARASQIDRLDADVSTRAAPGDQMALTPAEETAIQGKVLSDTTPFAGASIAAIKAKTDLIGTSVATAPAFSAYHYEPGYQQTGNIAGAGKTIDATSEQGVPDYTASLTLPVPTAVMTIRTIAARIAATLGGGAASMLWCRVYIDEHDSDHRLFNINLMDGSQNPKAAPFTSASPTIFGLLTDGQAHNYLFFLFTDAATKDISALQLTVGVGATDDASSQNALQINHIGYAHITTEAARDGSGSVLSQINFNGKSYGPAAAGGAINRYTGPVYNPQIGLWTDVASDAQYLTKATLVKES